MNHFTAHCLRFVAEVVEPIELNPHQGSAIRGAFFHALTDSFCMNKPALAAGGCAYCPLVASCPIAFLVATLNPQADRGADIPRPFTIQPPLHGQTRYLSGERLEFGLTMFARALNLFPYLILGLQRLEQGGLGKRWQQPDGRWRRGTFRLVEIWAQNPLTGEAQRVLHPDDTLVHVPDLPVTHHQVCQQADLLADRLPDHLTLHFLTPTRLIHQGHLVKKDSHLFSILFHRLMERLESLTAHYSDTPLDREWRALLPLADTVRVVQDKTRWLELESYSTRKQGRTPISGLVGSVTFSAGDWTPFLPWLIWGQIVHVGKDTVKGNGWYLIR